MWPSREARQQQGLTMLLGRCACGSVYFALKTQDADGDWSGLSNNTFWLHFDVYLPSVVNNQFLSPN